MTAQSTPEPTDGARDGEAAATSAPSEIAAPESATSETAAPETVTSETAAPETATSEAVVDAPATADAPATSDAAIEPTAPEAPAPRPAPRPAPVPRPMPRATRPIVESGSGAATAAAAWGRVADDGTVSVRESDGWREVGQYPDGTPAEALAYYERKYADLAGEVALLEARHRRGGASATDLRGTAAALRDKVSGAAAVGDLASLEARLDALTDELAAASASEAAAAREAVDAAVAERTALVEQAEALAAKDPRSVQWKQTSAELSSLFDQWQAHQQSAPRLPKSTAQALWKRFRDARAIVDKHRREFYAELDETHKLARDAKTRLVERAEALAPKGEDGIGAYRELLEQWKASGRAGKKVDDALWARFKAAGDALYGARVERESSEIEASREKIEAKRALLVEAAAVAAEPEIAKARSILTGIQRRWDEIGRIFPRDRERALDDELRGVEQALRAREDIDWKRNNPETKARAGDMARQLTEAIEKLEAEVVKAQASGDARALAAATEALEARRDWLRAVGG